MFRVYHSMAKATRDLVIRLRGLPFTAKENDIKTFLTGVRIKQLNFTYNALGKPTGEAFVTLEHEQDYDAAMSYHNGTIGQRYVEIMSSSMEELKKSIEKNPRPDGTVRLFGLPFEITKDEIANFFKGYDIVSDGIGILVDRDGRPTGEAFVQFASESIAETAVAAKHNASIGHRYVEVYRSNLVEANNKIQQQMRLNMRINWNADGRSASPWINPYWQFSQTGYAGPDTSESSLSVQSTSTTGHRAPFLLSPIGLQSSTIPTNRHLRLRMRGLPFAADIGDILAFFAPIQPVSIRKRFNKAGKPNGEAEVEFASDIDKQRALERDRDTMESRYIELLPY